MPDEITRDRYCEVRTLTEWLATPLSPEDQTVQSMPDVSPTKWHRAHTSWFFETFLLKPHLAGYGEYHPLYGYLFNSYYETVGSRHPRPARGLVTRPGVEEIAGYRRHVDAAMADLLDRPLPVEVHALAELGLHHEQQHQELLLMDIKHVLSRNPLQPSYQPPAPRREGGTPDTSAPGWFEHEGGLVEVGRAPGASGFGFDNESPRHRVWVDPFAVATRLVTAGEWASFIEDGGYRRPDLWLSDGWYAVQAEGWTAPLYWTASATGWELFTLNGPRPVDPAEPVCHVSYYEADAFARWAGARLPTEAEWEVVASAHAGGAGAGGGAAGERSYDPASVHPRPAARRAGVQQLFGEVWQWTSSSYVAYPGFVPAPGAVGEYNGKFMVGQQVLRGSCCATPPGHARPTYRNFFPPGARWPFTGLRLARDAG